MAKAWGAVDSLGLTGTGNPLEAFRCQRCTPTRTKQRESVRDEVGEHLPDTNHSFNEVIGYDAEYECTLRTLQEGITIPVGSTAELEITQIVISQVNNKYARIQVMAHEHPDTNFGEHLAAARDIVLPDFLGFGATDFLEVFVAVDVQSARYTITIEHNDAPNNVGEHLVGRSFGEMHEATIDAIVAAAPADPAAPWKRTSAAVPKVNTDHTRVSMTATKLIAGPS